MIPQIACYIKDLMMASGLVNTHFEWTEHKQIGDVTEPMEYMAGSVYDSVLNNDVGGNSYLRKSGKVTFGSPTGTSKIKYKSCGDSGFYAITLPLRLVACIPKSKLSDNAFSDELLGARLAAILSSDVTVSIDGVQSIDFELIDYDTDPISVWNTEVKGAPYQMRFDLSYIAVNFKAVIIANPSCLNFTCDGY